MDLLSEKAAVRLQHVSSHVNGEFADEDVALSAENLLKGKGSEVGSLRGLESYSRGKAIYSWFGDGNLRESKAWFATSSWLKKRRLSLTEPRLWRGATTPFRALDCACIEHADIRRAIGVVVESLYPDADTDPLAFISHQVGMLLQGRSEASAAATERFLNRFEFNGSKSIYLSDIDFFRYMHFGSDGEVAASLKRICQISSLASRTDLDDGFTEGLVSTPATIYLRLCWGIGRKVQVEDDLIPMEWMPKAELPPDYFMLPIIAP